MLLGILYGIAACLIWGSVYVAPLLLADFSPLFIALVRYALFGVLSLAVVAASLRQCARAGRADWLQAAALGIVGNLVYYWLLAEAVVRIGGALAGVFSSMIPVVATITANLTERHPLPWRRLLLPLGMIAGGLILFNVEEFARLTAIDFFKADHSYAVGLVFAVASVAVWTWYPLANAHWLKAHVGFPSNLWLAMQGAALLPVSAAGLLLLPDQSAPWAEINGVFVLWMLILAVGCSWIGNGLWNAMSRRLPAVLIGQMLIFETLAAVLYASLWQHSTISPAAAFGLGAQLLGIGLTVHLCRHPTTPRRRPENRVVDH